MDDTLWIIVVVIFVPFLILAISILRISVTILSPYTIGLSDKE